MKLKTVRVRRSRPSALSAALALMITMLVVYLVSLPARTQGAADPAAGQVRSGGDVRMEGLNTFFDCEGRYADILDARVAAAKCVQAGGAGLILQDGDQYAVIRSASANSSGENTLHRSTPGLTLHIRGTASEITAVADAAAFLYAQATETAGLAHNLENGNADAATMETLINIYRTQGKKALAALEIIQTDSSVVTRLQEATEAALGRLYFAGQPKPAQIRLAHAAACADWLSLLESFAAQA